MKLSSIGTSRKAEKTTAAYITVDGKRLTIPRADLAEHNTAEKLTAEIERQAKAKIPVTFHVNRDGSIALAVGKPPDVWPEDAPNIDSKVDHEPEAR